jgi:hypothetical protein
MRQLPLIRGIHLPPLLPYSLLWDNLPSLSRAPARSSRGRKGYQRDPLLRALVFRCLAAIPTLTGLVDALNLNPSLVECLGLNPLHGSPPVERFSAFVRDTSNSTLQQVRQALLSALIQENVVQGKGLALDSCPVIAPLRENNLKTRLLYGRFDKNLFPKADPDARLGVRIHFANERKVTYFWGYRNHTISDAESELPLWEETYPANTAEVTVAVPMLRAVKALGLATTYVAADSAYDAESVLACILNELHAQPIVPRRSTGPATPDYTIRDNQVLCTAGLPMVHKGKMTVNGYTYRQYACPLHLRKSFQQKFLVCPVFHPKFFEQKGCNALIRLTPSVRSLINYDTEEFRALYHKRTAVERSYSRLLSLTLEQPTVHGLNANRNHCTIAHIATLVVALTASRLGEPEKIRAVRSFIPSLSKKPIL